MLERDTLVYLGPEKFPTRRNELQLKKPGKEITIDHAQLIVKEKPSRLYVFHEHRAGSSKCFSQESSRIRSRRDMFIQHHDKLSRRPSRPFTYAPPPPGYSPISIQQILRADRATFIFLAERMTSLKRDATNRIPMDLALPNVLGQAYSSFPPTASCRYSGKAGSHKREAFRNQEKIPQPSSPK